MLIFEISGNAMKNYIFMNKKITNTQLKERCRGISNKNLSYYKETVAINMHPCILMEYLGPSILNLLEANGLVGLSMRMIQDSMKCVLSTLKELASIGVMHMDVKPENILQSKDDVHLFKLIDFHCAGIMGRPNPSYVQSRFFRAPEVLLHVDYDMKIDVWSLAATAFEMFIGVPLFPGDTEVQMLYLINKMLGPFPESLIKNSPRRNTFFLADGKMKPADRLAEENMEDVKTWKSWFKYDTIADNIMTYSTISSTELSEEEYNNRRVFVDLLEKCLKLDPVERISANDALMHPFFSLKLE